MRAILMMMILVAAAIAAPAWAESDLDATLARIGAKADLALMTMQSRPRAAAAPVAEKAKEGGATPTAGAAETPPAAGKTAPAAGTVPGWKIGGIPIDLAPWQVATSYVAWSAVPISLGHADASGWDIETTKGRLGITGLAALRGEGFFEATKDGDHDFGFAVVSSGDVKGTCLIQVKLNNTLVGQAKELAYSPVDKPQYFVVTANLKPGKYKVAWELTCPVKKINGTFLTGIQRPGGTFGAPDDTDIRSKGDAK